MNRSPSFEYGYDVQNYISRAVEIFRTEYHYHWADASIFNSETRYAIEKGEDGAYHYIRRVAFSDDDVETEILDIAPWSPYPRVENAEDFIRRIVSDQEYCVFHKNHPVANYRVSVTPGLKVDGWYIERYEFNRLETGDYAAFVQAGDRTGGASRDFFIPPEFFSGTTFDEFLTRYETLVPASAFGLSADDLRKDPGLRAFLGFSS